MASKKKAVKKDKQVKKVKKTSLPRKILKIVGILVITVIVLIIGASIAVYVIVDKPFVESQMSKALHRQVSIDKVSVGIISVLSGIEVKDMAISNYKTDQELQKLSGKVVPEGDRFVTLKSFTFKVAFGPLLSKRLVLKELSLDGLTANIVKYKNGRFNFSDLTDAKTMTAEEKKAEAEKKKAEAEKKKAEAAKKAKGKETVAESKPLSADDIPVKISVGKIGIENGTINLLDQSSDQKFAVYAIKAIVRDIVIDPKDLNNADIAKIDAGFGIKSEGPVTNGSVKSFDIVVSANGQVIPFDKKTRLLNPEVSLKVGSSKGMMTGLQIFDKMKSNGTLEKFSGKFEFLTDDIEWKDAYADLWYKGNVVKLSNGKIKTDNYDLKYNMQVNTATLGLAATVDMLLAKKHTESVQNQVKAKAEKLIVGKAKSLVTADKVAEVAMKQIVNKDGQIVIKYNVKGTLTKPDPDLYSPKFPSLKDVVKESAGDISDIVKDKAKDVAKSKVDENKDKAADKAKDKLKKFKLK